MVKVYFEPQYLNRTERADGGVRRVTDALMKYLPQYGIEVVTSTEEADLTAGHGMLKPYVTGKPFISHNHGLMWHEYFNDNFSHETNRNIVDSFVHADAITVPSEWVKNAITRGILKVPQVIYHGVDVDEWENKERDYESYVIWNKARQDAVSDSGDMQRIAELMPDVQFVSTLGQQKNNVDIIGVHPINIMRPFVQHAGLYLATARETFGIGTLEALAAGVPVVGWDYGGQQEIIRQGETGYLAPFGDYSTLADYIRLAFSERRRLSENAILDARTRWQWQDKIEQYARLYQRTLGEFQRPRPKVSVIMPCYNLARFLQDALNSVANQSLQDWECIVIDDCSTDETPDVAKEWIQADPRFKYFKTPTNSGLSFVRNFGFSHSQGKYIVCLDADDMLPPQALELLSDALDKDSGIHIVYGSLDLMTEQGMKRNRFPGEFNWFSQMAHQNQISTAAMMKREVIELSGGWRTRMWRAEDAEFWSRVTSFGFRAKKVTQETTLWYRIRSDSKGAIEFNTYADRDGNWLANIGWRTANSAQEGVEYLQKFSNTVSRPELVPFGAQGLPKDTFWKVSHQEQPLLTVVIDSDKPIDVLDALIGQDFTDWECYVIGKPITGFPFVRFVDDKLQVKARGLATITLTDNQIATDYLRSYLETLDAEPFQMYLATHTQKTSNNGNGKVLVEYTGTNGARLPYRVNGHTYLGARNSSIWVEREDVNELISRGKWKVAAQTVKPIPGVATAEARR